MLGIVKVAQSFFIYGEGNFFLFARSQFHFLETFQLFDRTGQRGFLITDIQLYDFLSFAVTGILHGYGKTDLIIGRHHFLISRRFAISKRCVRQPVSEGEQWFYLLLLVRPTIPHKDAFVVFHIYHILTSLTDIFANAMSRNIFQTGRKSERQLAGRIGIPHQHGSD